MYAISQFTCIYIFFFLLKHHQVYSSHFYQWTVSVTVTSQTGEHTHTHTHTHTHAHVQTHTHTHRHTWNRMPDEKIYSKHVHILENVVNICIINDLSYPPTTHPQIIWMHLLVPDPQIIRNTCTAICASLLRRYQQHHWVVKLPSWGNKWVEISFCRLCEKDAFHTRSGNRTTLEYIEVIIHILLMNEWMTDAFI